MFHNINKLKSHISLQLLVVCLQSCAVDLFFLFESKLGLRRRMDAQILMYSGYAAVGLIIVIFVIIFWLHKRKKQGENVEAGKANKVASFDDNDTRSIITKSDQYVAGESKSGFFVTSSAEQSANFASTSLLVLTSPVVNGLKFDDLLKAPAELLGRGRHSTLYKIVLENGVLLVVKRIKDWEISTDDFKLRMQRLNQVKHQNVLPAVAFYCSKQEKLLVYEYLQKGSLFRLLHGVLATSNFIFSFFVIFALEML